MKKILCIADSMALPRAEVLYEETWYHMLSKKWNEKYSFIHYFTRGLLISHIKKQYDLYYQFYKPHYIIWQSGITDCAPRIINENAPIWKIIIYIINQLGITKLFWKVIKLFFKRNSKCVKTTFDKFCIIAEEVIVSFIQDGVEKIIIIKICKIGESIQKKNPDFLNNIHLYNKCFDYLKEKYPDKVIIIDPLKDANDNLYVDGYHTNRFGAIKVFEALNHFLDNFDKTQS